MLKQHAAQYFQTQAEECLLSGQGESLWRQLVARYGFPEPVERWSASESQQLLCFETFRDGYGGGTLATGARPEDFAPGHPGVLRVYRFTSPISAPNWQHRLSNNPWDSLSDVPFLR